MRAQSQSGAEGKPANIPDMKLSVRQVFGIDSDLEVPAFSKSAFRLATSSEVNAACTFQVTNRNGSSAIAEIADVSRLATTTILIVLSGRIM